MGKARMSSSHYVSAILREAIDETTGKYSVGECSKIPTRWYKNCDHVQTICTACANSWSIDYHLRWGATAAGRSMRDMMHSGLYPINLWWAPGRRRSYPEWFVQDTDHPEGGYWTIDPVTIKQLLGIPKAGYLR